jgi:thiamine-phosphate diphosphorylase
VTGGAADAALRGVFVLADDGTGWRHGPVEQARAACRGGARAVQLRAKRSPDRDALALAVEIRAVTHEAGVLFFVDDRFDLALAAAADGVHLGQQDVPPQALPERARRALLVGRSTHTRDQILRAREEPVDYVAFGPVFGTTSKESGYEARGLAALAEAARLAAPRPLVAIGGIGAHNAREVARAGAAGIAVISAVAGAVDPEGAVRALVAAFGSDTSPPP